MNTFFGICWVPVLVAVFDSPTFTLFNFSLCCPLIVLQTVDCMCFLLIYIILWCNNPLHDAGAPTFPNSTFGWVNVKDVAEAHILAFEVASASGRYCLVERVVHNSEIVKILRELYPAIPLPEK